MFKIHSKYKPSGAQPKAIEALIKGLNEIMYERNKIK